MSNRVNITAVGPVVHRTETIDVSMEMAERWLETKAPNRVLREPLMMDYALLMENGFWKLTHQGLAFDQRGRLVDGQHRLKALTLQRPGTRFKFAVTRGLTDEEVLAIDMGRQRDTADSLTIYRGEKVTKHETAIANRVMKISQHYAAQAGKTPGSNWRVSSMDMNVFLRAHEAAMHRAHELRHRSKTHGISSAMLAALVFRAYYHLPTRRLDALIDVLATGHYDDKDTDSAGLLLRDHIMSGADGYRGTNLLDHFRMERAIKAFWKGERITKIFPATEELFPLPEEKGDGAAKVPAIIRRMEAARSEKARAGGATKRSAANA